jgi:hypothetical protein
MQIRILLYFDADPDPVSHNDPDPDPQHCLSHRHSSSPEQKCGCFLRFAFAIGLLIQCGLCSGRLDARRKWWRLPPTMSRSGCWPPRPSSRSPRGRSALPTLSGPASASPAPCRLLLLGTLLWNFFRNKYPRTGNLFIGTFSSLTEYR